MKTAICILIENNNILIDVDYEYVSPELDYESGTGISGGYIINKLSYKNQDITEFLSNAVGDDALDNILHETVED